MCVVFTWVNAIASILSEAQNANGAPMKESIITILYPLKPP